MEKGDEINRLTEEGEVLSNIREMVVAFEALSPRNADSCDRVVLLRAAFRAQMQLKRLVRFIQAGDLDAIAARVRIGCRQHHFLRVRIPTRHLSCDHALARVEDVNIQLLRSSRRMQHQNDVRPRREIVLYFVQVHRQSLATVSLGWQLADVMRQRHSFRAVKENEGNEWELHLNGQ